MTAGPTDKRRPGAQLLPDESIAACAPGAVLAAMGIRPASSSSPNDGVSIPAYLLRHTPIDPAVNRTITANVYGSKANRRGVKRTAEEQLRKSQKLVKEVRAARTALFMSKVVSLEKAAKFLDAVSDHLNGADASSTRIHASGSSSSSSSSSSSDAGTVEALVTSELSLADVFANAARGDAVSTRVRAGTGDWSSLAPFDFSPFSLSGAAPNQAYMNQVDKVAREQAYVGIGPMIRSGPVSDSFHHSVDVWTNAPSSNMALEQTQEAFIVSRLTSADAEVCNALMPIILTRDTTMVYKAEFMMFHTQPMEPHTHFVREPTVVHSVSRVATRLGSYGIATENTLDYYNTPEGRLVKAMVGPQWTIAAILTRYKLTFTEILSVKNRQISYLKMVGRKDKLDMAGVQEAISAAASSWNCIRKNGGFTGIIDAFTKAYDIENVLPGPGFSVLFSEDIKTWLGRQPSYYSYQQTGFPHRGGPFGASQVKLDLGAPGYALGNMSVGSRGPDTPLDHPLLTHLSVTGHAWHLCNSGTENRADYTTKHRNVSHYNPKRDVNMPITLHASFLAAGLYSDNNKDELLLSEAGVPARAYGQHAAVDLAGDDDDGGGAAKYPQNNEALAHRAAIDRCSKIDATSKDIHSSVYDWKLTTIGMKFFSLDQKNPMSLHQFMAGSRGDDPTIPGPIYAAFIAAIGRLTPSTRMKFLFDLTAGDINPRGVDPNPATYDWTRVLSIVSLATARTFLVCMDYDIPLPNFSFLVCAPWVTHKTSQVVAVKGGRQNMAFVMNHIRVAESIDPIMNWTEAQLTLMMGAVIKRDESVHRMTNAWCRSYEGGGDPIFLPLSKYGLSMVRDPKSKASYISMYTGAFTDETDPAAQWNFPLDHVDITGKFHSDSGLAPEERKAWLYPSASVYAALFTEARLKANTHVAFSPDFFDPGTQSTYTSREPMPRFNTVVSRSRAVQYKDGELTTVLGRDVFGDQRWTADGSARYRCGLDPAPPISATIEINGSRNGSVAIRS
jgi:hypothetical protein